MGRETGGGGGLFRLGAGEVDGVGGASVGADEGEADGFAGDEGGGVVGDGEGREGASGDKAELFRMVVCASRGLIHNTPEKARLRDELFQNDSATLAHMAILLGG